MFSAFLTKNKHSFLYGLCLAISLLLLKWVEYRFIVFNYSLEIYIGSIATVFTALGIWLALQLARPKTETITIEKEVYVYSEPAAPFTPDKQEFNTHNLSKRETEVLALMAQGLSNQEIADCLFVSLNTIKTHSSKIYEKLDVRRRTQAVEIAKRAGIIP